MILIIEPRSETCRDIVATVRWIDARHRVATAENGFDALKSVRRLRPHIILLGPGTPIDLAMEIRAARPQAYIVSLGCSGASDGENPWDTALEFPFEHARLGAVIASSRRGHLATAREPRKRVVRSRRSEIKVTLRHADTDALKFHITAPAGVTVGSLLKQIGKDNTLAYYVTRNGEELSTNLSTPLQDGDELTLRTSQAVDAGIF